MNEREDLHDIVRWERRVQLFCIIGFLIWLGVYLWMN